MYYIIREESYRSFLLEATTTQLRLKHTKSVDSLPDGKCPI